MKKIFLPKLGQTMEEAGIEKWHVKEGDTVASGDVIAEITTDKATLEVQSFHAGTVRKILTPAGATVPVGTVIALVGAPDEPVTDDLLAAAPAALKASAEKTVPEAGAAAGAPPAIAVSAGRAGRIFASPRAKRLAEAEGIPLAVLRGSGPDGRIVEADVLAYREKLAGLRLAPLAKKLAHERGVDLLALTGSGTDGRILPEDVEAACAAPRPAAAALAGRREPLSAMRRIVAERMSQSKREVPHYYLTMEIDMTAAVELRAGLNAAGDIKVSFNDLIAKAAAIAVKDVPEVNAKWDGDAILYGKSFNIGIAVGLDAGLIVPVIRDAVGKSLVEIARASADLIARARSKKLTPDEYEGGSITLTNLGMFDVDNFIPVINPGEAVILGIGRIADRPVVINGGIHVRKVMKVTLSGDHRVIDGARAAAFLKAVKDLLEKPDALAS
ncbi:MAG: dihydrolipoamide acetyltransferase family protein [Planctomycetota bacterium]